MRFATVAYYLKHAEEAIDPAGPDADKLRDACFIARQYMEMLSKDYMLIAREEIEDGREENVLNENH